MTNTLAADFFNDDNPLPEPMDGWRAEWAARMAILACWEGHDIAVVNGHLVWWPESTARPSNGRVFYDGDYSDVLPPHDPRILIPRSECEEPLQAPRLEWSE